MRRSKIVPASPTEFSREQDFTSPFPQAKQPKEQKISNSKIKSIIKKSHQEDYCQKQNFYSYNRGLKVQYKAVNLFKINYIIEVNNSLCTEVQKSQKVHKPANIRFISPKKTKTYLCILKRMESIANYFQNRPIIFQRQQNATCCYLR